MKKESKELKKMQELSHAIIMESTCRYCGNELSSVMANGFKGQYPTYLCSCNKSIEVHRKTEKLFKEWSEYAS